MKELKRTKVGNFYIKTAITVSDLEQKIENNDLSNIITIEDIFMTKEKIELPQKYLKEYLNGVKISMDKLKILDKNTLKEDNKIEDVCRVYANDKFIGIGEIKENSLKRDIVIDENV